jgi:hypothetical protein
MTTLVIFILGCGYFLYNIERDLSEHEFTKWVKKTVPQHHFICITC